MNSDYLWHKSWPTGIKKTRNYPTFCIHEMFIEIAKKNPDLPFLSILGINYSYKQIDEESSKLATALIDCKGIKQGNKVGLFMPNIPQYVIGFLAILKIGAIIVPISPLLGSEDLKHKLINSKVKTIIALDLLYPTLEEVCPNCESLESIIITSLGDLLSPIKRTLARLLRKLPKSPEVPKSAINFYDLINKSEPIKEIVNCNQEDIAVIAYTGGTTGKPKGAMLTHKNIVTNVYQLREWAMVTHPEDTHKNFLGAVPFFHIIGLTSVFLCAIAFESTIYLIPNPRDFKLILKTIEKNSINYFHGVPTLFRAIMNLPDFSKYNTKSLDIIFSGGAPLPAELGKRIEKEFNGPLVVEAYGMTELSPAVAANPMEKNKQKFGSIGLPLPDTIIKIVDLDTKQELNQGEVGEICIKGPQVMMGYYNNPKETKFIMDEEEFLHTGDTGYFDNDGYIFIVGRVKDLINISGYKVFPSEIEEIILNQFKELEEVVIIPSPDEYRGETVKLVAVLKEGSTLESSTIVDYLSGKVAKYKVPRKFEFLDELPKTSIGKIDRLSLKKKEFGN